MSALPSNMLDKVSPSSEMFRPSKWWSESTFGNTSFTWFCTTDRHDTDWDDWIYSTFCTSTSQSLMSTKASFIFGVWNSCSTSIFCTSFFTISVCWNCVSFESLVFKISSSAGFTDSVGMW